MPEEIFEGLTPAERKKIEERLARGKKQVADFVLGDPSTRDQIRHEVQGGLRRSLRNIGLSEAEIQARITDLPNQARLLEQQLPPRGRVIAAKIRRLGQEANPSVSKNQKKRRNKLIVLGGVIIKRREQTQPGDIRILIKPGERVQSCELLKRVRGRIGDVNIVEAVGAFGDAAKRGEVRQNTVVKGTRVLDPGRIGRFFGLKPVEVQDVETTYSRPTPTTKSGRVGPRITRRKQVE